ncbi:O-antigen ligase family protein [Streptomyces acidiscabies]|uniref:O-antigen ligase family protein n=1 Tax=Streptomyces acidiscabies TaxID=42234 RepID=A0AAP6EHQ1_9ACTN|nr:O-antigen ligase family protein [Streptomyces acidiscabies]MBP5939539.1 O-antigen ligase family protein [Streptomyces sp. LBUM 1476]MBZ3910695.1 O-antigen ligase family protein [Streptomyces acidiscabies]MDX2963124.1 O-antigen ligase family protein [Streptomyces acidiscabies]MDX3017309.1 O-antigen ligase family protein [Streptomyces acidiscabies]MDX3787806.1 O-antigen ligase family protein [Streptomyces acidiscabies]
MALALPLTPPRSWSPVLPVAAVIALIALPVAPGGEGGAGPADALSALVVLFCVVRLLRQRVRPLSRRAAVLFAMPVAGLTLAALGASSASAGMSGLGRYLQIFVLVPATVLLLIRDARDFRLLAWSFVGLAGWQGAVGVHQFVTHTGASYQGEEIRAVGTFGPQDVMGMATVVSFGLICSVGLALGRSVQRERMIAAACAGALLIPLALSFSRGAWIATALTCSVQLVLAGLRRALKVGAVVAALGVVLVGGLGIGSAMLQERVSSITQVTDTPDQSVTDRYTMWAAAIGMWREQPLTGVGLKGFPEHRDAHASLALSSGSDTEGAGSAYVKQPLLSPHNMYLLILSEQGLLGLLALAGGWLALLTCALRNLAREHKRQQGSLDCALIACGLSVWQLTDFMYADIGGPSTVLTAICVGLIAWWGLAGKSEGASAR